jgi:hypothetical protein
MKGFDYGELHSYVSQLRLKLYAEASLVWVSDGI